MIVDDYAQVVTAETSDPELFAKWIGPNYLQTRIDEFDCTTGGRYRYASVADGEEYDMAIFFDGFNDSEANAVFSGGVNEGLHLAVYPPSTKRTRCRRR